MPPLHSDAAIPPGEFLREHLDDLGISQAELARRIGRPRQVVNAIACGKKAITAETALQLERTLKTPAHVWLEQEYRLARASGPPDACPLAAPPVESRPCPDAPAPPHARPSSPNPSSAR